MKNLTIERRLRLSDVASELANIGYWELDAATQQISWSNGMFRIFGLPPGDEPALATAMELVHPDDRRVADESLSRALTSGEPYSTVTRIVWPTGEIRHLQGRAFAERTAEGVVAKVVGVLADKTEEMRALEALQLSETRYRTLAEHATDVVLRIDLNDTVLYVSPSCRRYGYEPEELIGLTGYELTHPDDQALLRQLVAELFSGAPIDCSANRDYRLRAKDGSWIWVEGFFCAFARGDVSQ